MQPIQLHFFCVLSAAKDTVDIAALSVHRRLLQIRPVEDLVVPFRPGQPLDTVQHGHDAEHHVQGREQPHHGTDPKQRRDKGA